ncbi:MAG: NAD-dependent epimerase/dehydratase family protein [Anditalea sp.]
MNRIAIISGSSGLVGTQLLHQLFKQDQYDYVISVGRRELTLKHRKLVQIKVDFEHFEQVNLEDQLREKDIGGSNHRLIKVFNDKDFMMHAFCSLGTTIKDAGSKESFYKIDHDFVIGFARWTHQLGATKFLYVSAIGADATSSIFYNKVKGQVEEDLKLIPFDYLGIFQPSILLGHRRGNRLGEEVGKVVMKIITALGIYKKYKPIYDYQVAKAMVHHATKTNERAVEVISSREMLQLNKEI